MSKSGSYERLSRSKLGLTAPERQDVYIISNDLSYLSAPRATAQLKPSYERHHILFRENDWEKGTATKALRRHVALYPRIGVDAHEALHSDPELRHGVPLLNQEMASRVLRRYEGSPGGGLASTEELMRIVESEKDNLTNPLTQRLIAEAAMIALDAQRPYLR